MIRNLLDTPLGIWRRAAPPETILYLAGLALILSGCAHAIPAAIWPVDFDSSLSWRKPILFGLSTGVTLLSLGWILGLVRAPAKITLSLLVAAPALLEVFLISLQTWRGEASHFNNSTPVNALIHYTIDACVLAITGVIVYVTILALRQTFHSDGAMRLAVRAGLIFLTLSCLFGIFMLAHGLRQIEAGLDYRYWGEAGVLKFVHGVSIHAAQTLPFLVWLATVRSISETPRYRLTLVAIAGQALLLAYACVQTFAGRGRFDLEWRSPEFVLLSLGLIAAIVPFLVAGFPPLRRGIPKAD